MKYKDGTEVKIGDKIKLWEDCYGIVVASIDAGEYDPSYLKKEWEYLKSGILVNSDKAGLVHYSEAEDDWELIARSVQNK